MLLAIAHQLRSYYTHWSWQRKPFSERLPVSTRYRNFRSRVQGFKAILAGEYDIYPEAAFYMVGAIEDVVTKAEQLAAQTS